ncbi:hypothetical protein FEM48_Zijuj01G0101000 [Ziziphus jujuba var. spinosa]|uniref:Gnk2-homologous domain-containing protein n=1 Tax=Ziziphus jujuba var. spinosa TaxID=714518 RepID=A0A978W0M1_ZIZJJ|nr:hypothetical protein FEM48_Zijuj01G0101000 [Ziziphus jujuba var. spinosa]
METTPAIFVWECSQHVLMDLIKWPVLSLLDGLRNESAGGDSDKKYAAVNATTAVLCKPDLSESDCNDRLYNGFQGISECCIGKRGARYIGRSCNIRYGMGVSDSLIQ